MGRQGSALVLSGLVSVRTFSLLERSISD